MKTNSPLVGMSDHHFAGRKLPYLSCTYSARKGVSSAQLIHFQKRSTHPSKKSKNFVPGWKAAGTNYLICNDKSHIMSLVRLQPPLKKILCR
jgi:hypothetical protein